MRLGTSWIALAAALFGCATTSSARTAQSSFGATVAEIERVRGVAFVRGPELEIVAAGDAFAAARSAAGPLVPIACPGPGFALRDASAAFADVARDRVVAARGADPRDVRVALAHLLDAQRYPELLATARRLGGDAAVAVHAVLAASACATAAGGLGSPPDAGGDADPFADAVLALDGPSEAVALLQSPVLAASDFLQRAPDREAVFRRPPLSTAELLIPGRWALGEGAVALVGAVPALPGCAAIRDESVGVFALVRAFFGHGGRAARGAFVGWRGDRLVAFACEGARAPWIHVALFERARDAADFRDAAAAILPPDWPRPFDIRADDRRVTAWHALDADAALAFAAALEARPLR